MKCPIYISCLKICALILFLFLFISCSNDSTSPDSRKVIIPTAPYHIWSQNFSGTNVQRSHCVAIDGSGNTIITGYFSGAVNFGGGLLTSAGNYDIFLAKFDSDGGHIWSKSFGDASDQSARSVTCDGSGNVVVTGDFYGSTNFGGGALTSAGSRDIFIAKFKP